MLKTTLKYEKALKNFGKIFNGRKQKEKHELLYPIRSAGLSYKQAKSLGFNVSFGMWKSCLDQRIRSKGKYHNIF